MLSCFSVVNVVWYDGVDAYASEFILQTVGREVTKDSKERTEKYLAGNGEILKYDYLYPISIDEMIEMRRDDNDSIRVMADRFATMFFKN